MILLVLAGCEARVAAGVGIQADVPEPAHYDRAVAAATRELRLYDGLTTALLVRATWLDSTFRRTFEAERSHLLLLEPDIRAARLAASLSEAEAAHAFVFSVDSQWRADLRFGFGDEEPWRLRAFVGGQPCTPETVAEIERPSALERALYPHQTPWSQLWTARFSADCGAGPPLLQFTGPHGTGEVGWEG